METISYIVLILLSLVGYSAGAVGKAGKSVQLKPQIIDLILISVIWAGAIYSRVVFDFNKWLMILVWVVLGILIGVLAIWPRKLPEERVSISNEPKEAITNLFKKLWQSWGSFSKRVGNFQSRIFLSLFFFILFSPLALAVKMFSDPLRIRFRGNESYWLPKMKTEVDLEQFRRQF
jgi:hypothetical protein